jgi:hypothetical protein
MKYFAIGAVAIAAAFSATTSYATPVPAPYSIEQSVNDLGHVGFGALGVDTDTSTGTNNITHYDYIFKFTLDNSGYISFSPTSSNVGEAHTILYAQDPTGLTTENLYHNHDSNEITPTNDIDIGNESLRSLSAGPSFDTASFGNPGGIWSAGTYYLRLFGTPGAIAALAVRAAGPSSIVGLLTVSAVTPIPAALPLFATAIAGLGFVGWRRKHPAA